MGFMIASSVPEWLTFAKVFLRHPRDVSSVLPTRKAIAKVLADRIAEKQPQVVIEYGPATGRLSREILSSGKLASGSSLVLIEKTSEFIEYLRATLHDPLVSIAHGSAVDVLDIIKQRGCGKADYIFSGIPLTLMAPEVANAIVANTHAALKDDGVFVQYAFRRNVEPILHRYFPSVRSDSQAYNLPPLTVYEARKHS